MALSKTSPLAEVGRDPRARANLVVFGLVLVTASIIVGALVLFLAPSCEDDLSLVFISRALGAVGGLFLGLGFLVPAVSDESVGTAMRIAYLAAGIIVLAGTGILPFSLLPRVCGGG